jgi:tetratricopeptide (TPR) repeat protein
MHPVPEGLVGRESAWQALLRAATPGAAVLVHGPPGIGKTALIQALLAHIPNSRWVDLTDARTAVEVAAAMARALGVALSEEGQTAPLEAALSSISVLALDSVERVDSSGWAWIAALRKATPRTAWVYGSVTRLPGVPTLPLGPLSPADARTMLLAAARLADLLGTVDEADPAWDRLVARLDGLPLALTLAGSRLGWTRPTELLDHLDEAVVRGAGRRESVEGALRYAWDLLGPDDRAALVRLALMPGGFSLRTAIGVLGPDAVRRIESLRAGSTLLARDGRLTVLGPLRRIAADAAADTDIDVVVAWWAAEGEVLRDAVRFATAAPAGTGLAEEQDNLVAALTLARRRQDGPRAAQLALAVLSSIRRYGPFLRVDALGDIGVLAEAAGDRELQSLVLAMWGASFRDRGMVERSETILRRAIDVAPPGPGLGRSVAWSDLGWIAIGRNQFDQARLDLQAAAEAAPDRFSLAVALNRLGGLESILQNRAAAAEAWERALDLLREHPVGQRAALKINLALVRGEEGRLVLASDLLRQAKVDAEHTDLPALASAQVILCMVLLATGDLEPALHEAEAALELHTALGGPPNIGLAHGTVGFCKWALGDLAAAREHLQQARGHLEGGYSRAASSIRAWRAALEAAAGDASALDAELAASGCDPLLAAVLAGFGGAPVPEPAGPEHLEVQVARRLLSAAPPALEVDKEGRWFSWPGHRADLSRRGALRRLFVALVEARLARPGSGLTVGELFDVGWPGERVMPDAAAARVYTAIRSLRAMGLGDALKREAEGYLLDPAVRVDVVG